MSKEKQIEEMAEITSRDCGSCSNCEYIGMRGDGVDCIDYFFAHTLYNAGYRKQSEGEWIDQYKGQYTNPIYICSMCGRGTLLRPHINELDNMEMVQALSPFCPNCGAKMKGGAE